MKRLSIALVLLGFSALASAEDLQRARELYQRTDYRGALEALKGQGLRSPEAMALAGKIAYMLGEPKRAAEYFEKALHGDAGNSDYYLWLGRAYGKRAETSSFLVAPKYASECRKAFEKAVELNPKNLEAWNDLLEFYLEAPGFLGGGTEKAARAARKIGELDPVERHFAQARLAEKKKEYTTAEQHLRHASEMAPQQIGRVIDLAKFLAKQGKARESEMAFLKAEKIDAGHPKLLFARAQVYVEGKRNLEAARRLLERYLQSSKLTPDDPPRTEAERLLRIASGI